jgi:hypothetical protein
MKAEKVAPGASITKLTDESMIVDVEMIDGDNMQMDIESRFHANSSIVEGCSGHLPIDTMYENTSQAIVDNPREGSTPAPACLNSEMLPHRRL